MRVSLVVYAWIYGWRHAAGFIVLLFVHEMGHFIAARCKGLGVGVLAADLAVMCHDGHEMLTYPRA
jgi:hypothetical protein